MTRIIIENGGILTDAEAVSFVQKVIIEGFTSTETIQGEKNVPKYCHVTTFKNDSDCVKNIVVAKPRKTKNSAYSFLVYTSFVDCVDEEIEEND